MSTKSGPAQFDAWLQAQDLLYAEVQCALIPEEEVNSALSRLAEQDAVIAGVVADLQALAYLGSRPGAGAGVDARPIDDLLSVWEATRSHQEVDRTAAVAEALRWLAVCAEEVTR